MIPLASGGARLFRLRFQRRREDTEPLLHVVERDQRLEPLDAGIGMEQPPRERLVRSDIRHAHDEHEVERAGHVPALHRPAVPATHRGGRAPQTAAHPRGTALTPGASGTLPPRPFRETSMSKHKLETLLVHAGEPRIGGSVSMPIFQSSTFETKERAGYHDIRYGRLSNTPSHDALHQKLAAAEGAEAALATSSGMSAISTTLLCLLRAGDHLVAQDSLYGGTHDLLTHDLPALGIVLTHVSGDDAGSWEKARRPRTKAFYCEAISNPLVRVADLEGIVAFARKHSLVSVIDNTFATPLGFRPIDRGFDLAVH